ncbi:hypothetical protein B5X24_HaOG200051 [Helicoverpa armigera]|uniref:Cytochrome P450 n=1 Tax=Helicoverpa armigera TaxID=29058 RepID=A0A2W1C027_HELAM|nr:hypothetical protein B5X24_HaOG200051 [Helicoverpa armigera]
MTMLTGILSVCVLCLVWLTLKGWRRARSSEHKLPPAMDGELPIIGHMHIVIYYVTNIYKFMKTLSDECAQKGGVMYGKFGSELYYFITDPQDSLIAASACLNRNYAYNLAKVWLGNNSLVLSGGETWKNRRKLLNPAFSLPVIHGFLDVFNSQAKKLINEFKPYVGKGPFDHSVYFLKTSSETLCVGTFGINPREAAEFTEKYEKALFDLIRLLIKKFLRFWLQNRLIYKLFGLKKKEDELVHTLHSMSEKVLQEKLHDRKNKVLKTQTNGTGYRPFLDLILDLSENGALTDREIREETDTIIFTGIESTSNQLTYILLLLGAHPDVQNKLYEEVLDIVGAERDVVKDDLNKLVYTNAVIMESLRVLPTVPLILRSVGQDVKLKNYTMRAGSHCLIFPLMPNVKSTSGTESDQFRPERWLNADSKTQQEFAGFGLGKRACLGRTYAIVMMKVVLAHFIRQYRVQADMSQLQLSADFAMKPVSGHEISIERRT